MSKLKVGIHLSPVTPTGVVAQAEDLREVVAITGNAVALRPMSSITPVPLPLTWYALNEVLKVYETRG